MFLNIRTLAKLTIVYSSFTIGFFAFLSHFVLSAGTFAVGLGSGSYSGTNTSLGNYLDQPCTPYVCIFPGGCSQILSERAKACEELKKKQYLAKRDTDIQDREKKVLDMARAAPCAVVSQWNIFCSRSVGNSYCPSNATQIELDFTPYSTDPDFLTWAPDRLKDMNQRAALIKREIYQSCFEQVKQMIQANCRVQCPFRQEDYSGYYYYLCNAYHSKICPGPAPVGEINCKTKGVNDSENGEDATVAFECYQGQQAQPSPTPKVSPLPNPRGGKL